MIPARLALRNFLSYGDACPPLDLDGIGLACLCGDNGHGKSTLIEAITWALWGRARGPDLDALIHQGRREMEVDFVFLAGEARYRVVRRRQRIGARGAGRPSLEFQVRHGDEWRPLTEPTVAQTEAAIERTIRLSYDTFVNSALLLQGKADLFTAAGPANRKKVLAEILNLARYGALEERARDARRARQQEALQLEGTLADIGPRAAALPALETERTTVAERRAEAERAVAELTATLDTLRVAQAALESERAALRQVEAELRREREALLPAERELHALAAAVAADEPVAATERAVRAGHERLQATRAAERAWAERLRRLRQIEEESQPLQLALARADAELKQRLATLRAQRAEARRDASRLPVAEKRVRELGARATGLHAEATALDREVTRHRELLDRVARLTAEREQAERRREERRTALAALAAAAEHGGGTCPLCRGPLTGDSLTHVRAAHNAEDATDRERERATDAALAQARRQAAELAAGIEERRGRLDAERARLGAETATARLDIDQAHAAAQRAARLAAEIDDLSRHQGGESATEARATLSRLREERAALAYSPKRHQDAARRVQDALGYEARFQDLLPALARLAANRPALDRQRALVGAARARVEALEERLATLTGRVGSQPDVAARSEELAGRLAARTDERAALDQHLGRLDGQIEECRALAVAERAHRSRLAALRVEEQIYADLATAFGRKGVQAFIIDAVLPEVEDEANRLLGQMTNGRMRLSLETQRETRAGDLAETLEIAITDERGARDYDMYSGGEAFRINLALRIALAKLLARRSGAPLPTLIIDEGFGVLDAAGRETIVDAVSAIRDDFQCLLVVTHIEELKQLFDTRIEVEKGERGSIARVVRV